jgi:dihydrofolate reductase
MRVSIIVAVAENGVIGRGGKLPWHLSDDLRRFKKLTTGHAIIMGRRTWESIGRVLPGRRMLIISRQAGYRAGVEGVSVAESLSDALDAAAAAADSEAFIIGGAELYREALARADRLYVTRVHAAVDGDTRFPTDALDGWRRVASEYHAADADNEFPCSFEVYERDDDETALRLGQPGG